jgi:hypothetical protein
MTTIIKQGGQTDEQKLGREKEQRYGREKE